MALLQGDISNSCWHSSSWCQIPCEAAHVSEVGSRKLRQTFTATSLIIDGNSRLCGYAFSIEQVEASENKAGKHRAAKLLQRQGIGVWKSLKANQNALPCSYKGTHRINFSLLHMCVCVHGPFYNCEYLFYARVALRTNGVKLVSLPLFNVSAIGNAC